MNKASPTNCHVLKVSPALPTIRLADLEKGVTRSNDKEAFATSITSHQRSEENHVSICEKAIVTRPTKSRKFAARSSMSWAD